ncbi:MAG TPA: Crp/Fnr family transcriptional regulator [Hyphomicrobiaceae bacterium]|nr:Crp/Fnr family transcriptional regulator [Hyphomicrobiaceae bacterium]
MSGTDKAGVRVDAAALGLDAVATAFVTARGRPVHAPKGTVVFEPGQECTSLVLLTEGQVAVRIVSEGGRELVLYRVRPGETCVMSMACLVGQKRYEAEGVCETDISGYAIDRAMFQDLLATNDLFRERVLAIQTERIFDLVGLVDEVAFHGLEGRLAGRLLASADGDGVVAETHQQLADAIGTAREVVSRRLKRLADRGAIRLERRRIVIVDRKRLAVLAH